MMDEEAINSHLLQAIDVDRINKFDDEISALFENIFYSYSHDVKIDVDEIGIVSHFLQNWKDTVGASSISKVLPSIITGSIVEGACLSRLFHPSHEKSLELEADVMYIVGSIDEQTASQCFENIGRTGFLLVKFSNDIKIFTDNKSSEYANLPILKDIAESGPKGQSYINGSKLKIMHKNRQPNDRRLQLNRGTPYLISVQQNISGPSSEIVFQTQRLRSRKHINDVLIFLESIRELLIEKCDRFVRKHHELSELQTILEIVVETMFQGEKKQLCQEDKEEERWITMEDARDIMRQVSEKLDELDSGNELLNNWQRELHGFIRSLALICYNSKDRHFHETIDLYMTKNIKVFENMRQSCKENPLNQEVRDKTSTFSKASMASTTLSVSYVKVFNKLPDQITTTINELQIKIEDFINELKAKTEDGDGDEDKIVDSISFDNVSCFYCPFWPTIAKEWKERERKWPLYKHVQKIINAGTFIVSKQHKEGIEHALEWRWSFSSAEIAIAKLRSPIMKYCYFIFKSFFYQYFKDFPGYKSLPSYIAKTCMLHLSEQHDESWWSDNGITMSVIQLFKYLQAALKKGYLTHYFINGLNLLADCPSMLTEQASEMVSRILSNPSDFLKIDQHKLTIIEKLEKEVKGLYNLNSSIERSPKEHYLYVTELYKQRYTLIADCLRSAWLYEYYGDLGQTLLLNKLIDAQEKMLLDKRGTGPQYDVIEQYYEQNKKVLLQKQEKLQCSREDIGKSLAIIGDLIKRYCKKCDGCSNPIPCCNPKFKCLQNCDYDLCETCNEEGVHPPHEHKMHVNSECSPYCYTQFTHERLGTDHIDEGRNISFKNIFDIKVKVNELGLLIGYGNKEMCSIFLDHGKIMNKLLHRLFNALDQKPEEVDDTNNEEDAFDKVNISTNTYEDSIRDIRRYIMEYNHRKLIEKIFFHD